VKLPPILVAAVLGPADSRRTNEYRGREDYERGGGNGHHHSERGPHPHTPWGRSRPEKRMVALGKSSRPEAAGVAQDQAGVGSEVLGWRLLTPRNRVDLGSKTVYTM